MDVFRTIAAQIEVMGLPLFAVTLTAVPHKQTPVLLMLHWHAFRSDPESPPSRQHRLSSVPSSLLQLNDDWLDLTQLDGTMLDAAWQLGAWELDREARRGCNTIGASPQEAIECRQAFGDDLLQDIGNTSMVSEAPDRGDMMHYAARVGYVRWTFRPVKGGIWRATAEDDTLAEDGSRTPPCPIGAQPAMGNRTNRTRYRLGHINRLLIL